MIDVNRHLKYDSVNALQGTIIACAYEQPHRKYHGWNHIVRLLELLHTVGEQHFDMSANELEWLERAVLLHDIVYVPTSTTNEIESALIAEMMWPQTPWMSIAIAATADHTSSLHAHLPKPAKVLLDLDLWDLATSKYEENGKLIEQEFMPFISSGRKGFLEGRLKWIRKMLDSERIFWLCTERESAARANLENDKEGVLRALEEYEEVGTRS